VSVTAVASDRSPGRQAARVLNRFDTSRTIPVSGADGDYI
jgi:hypothetical protein